MMVLKRQNTVLAVTSSVPEYDVLIHSIIKAKQSVLGKSLVAPISVIFKGVVIKQNHIQEFVTGHI